MRHRRDMRNLDASARLSQVLTSHELRSGIFLLPIKSTIKILSGEKCQIISLKKTTNMVVVVMIQMILLFTIYCESGYKFDLNSAP